MSDAPFPTLTEFVSGPIAEVQKVAPATMLYAPGGTRRSAVFAGIQPWSMDHSRWARGLFIEKIDLIFQHGVRHLLAPAITPNNVQEVHTARHKLYTLADWILAGEESLQDYAHKGWRVRMIGGENVPELQAATARLQSQTAQHAAHTLWWLIIPDYYTFWDKLLAAVRNDAKVDSRDAIVRTIFGEVIPPVALWLAFGKPAFSAGLLPPFLLEEVQCYWSQTVGHSLTAEQLRTIIYDYAYLRPTWQSDKLTRSFEATAHQAAWEHGPTLGLGMRLGPFWYPAPMSSPAWST